MNSELHDRINRVINTEAFEKSLGKAGICLFEFQSDWANYPSFEKLPAAYKKAIHAGERELKSGSVSVY